MQLGDAKQAWRTDGFAILPGYLSPDDLAPGLDELNLCFPTPTGFHEGSDPPPWHSFWTAETLAGVALRYPRLDLTPWATSHTQ